MPTNISQERRDQTTGLVIEELKRAIPGEWFVHSTRKDHPFMVLIAAPGEPVAVRLSFYKGEGHLNFRMGHDTYVRGRTATHRVLMALRGPEEVRVRVRNLVDSVTDWRAGLLGTTTDYERRVARAVELAGRLNTWAGIRAVADDEGTPRVTLFHQDGRVMTFNFTKEGGEYVRAEVALTADEVMDLGGALARAITQKEGR